jgi:hypothetical protein
MTTSDSATADIVDARSGLAQYMAALHADKKLCCKSSDAAKNVSAQKYFFLAEIDIDNSAAYINAFDKFTGTLTLSLARPDPSDDIPTRTYP